MHFLSLFLGIVLVTEWREVSASLKKLHRHPPAARGIACPVIRDEEGFLSEFVAYYWLHGFSHIRFYDDQTVDGGLNELQPWLAEGFVSVVNATAILFGQLAANKKQGKGIHKLHRIYARTGQRNAIQRAAEFDCKNFATRQNYDFLFSLDIDEYIVPCEEGVTILDKTLEIFRSSRGSILLIKKLNFASTPYMLEPVDMLTIEAYKIRMAFPLKMTFFKTVATKVILSLKQPNISRKQKKFMLLCCNFHNCIDITCRHYKVGETQPLFVESGNNATAPIMEIFHYSRSLEKFLKKKNTWTAIGENNFSMINFLDRNLGTVYDDTASKRYGKHVRQILRNISGESNFSRHGWWILKQKQSR